MLTVLVALAAGVGAVCRYLVDQAVQYRSASSFPAGTVLVNLTGSLLFGLITGLALHHGLARTPTLVAGAGFAGGYTTFSTWVWESLALAEAGAAGEAVLNVVVSIAAGLAVAAAGLAVALL
jgi:CrcB protein